MPPPTTFHVSKIEKITFLLENHIFHEILIFALVDFLHEICVLPYKKSSRFFLSVKLEFSDS